MNSSIPTTGDGAFCPSCERFIGPADECPYCGADSARSPVLRRLRTAALLLAVAGLALLLLMARHKELPLIKAGEITPMMNFASGRLIGTVVKNPYVGRSTNRVEYLSFLVDDGSGQLRVVADGRVALQMAEKQLIPGKGDSVEIAGTLNVAADGNVKLRVQSAEQVKRSAHAAQDSTFKDRKRLSSPGRISSDV